MGIQYIRETGGILKVAEEVLNFIVFVCIVSTSIRWAFQRGDAALAASIGGFIVTGILLVFHLFDIKDKIMIPWHKVQCAYCCIMFIFNIVVGALCIDITYLDAYVAGGVFGVLASIVYLVEAYYHFRHFNV